jgi:DNA adenine methylase
MKPILKWAGSKQQLLKELKKYITPERLEGNMYIEPFIGGGALAFDLEHKYTTISDLNPELTNLYEAIRDYPETVIATLRVMHLHHTPEFYYEIRAMDRDPNFKNSPAAERAARTIYLNKTCFNGLYRVNSKGYFNTPIGRTTNGKMPDIIQEDAIRELSKFLKTVDIRTGDYRTVINDIHPLPGTVIYLDPPYDPGEEISTGGFVSYQKEGWTREDLKLMKSECDYWSRLGCRIVVSNNDTPFVRELFSDWEIHEVDVRRSINRNGDSRKGKEVIITNY